MSSTLRSVVTALLSGVIVAGASFGPVAPVTAATPSVVDDFEAGLPAGVDANGIGIGYVTFNDPNSGVAIATTTSAPADVPGSTTGNAVLRMDLNVVSYAGFVHAFQNAAVDTWVTRDWSASEGLSFWLYGNNSGTTLFVDVLDNRNPGSTRDDAERWSTDLADNFSGWKLIEIPFTSLHRKEIGNGAPNDGLGLTEVNGWALGSITTPAPQTYYVDNAALYGTAPVRPLTVGFKTLEFPVMEGGTASVTAKLSRPTDHTVTVDYATSIGTAIAGRDYIRPAGGTLTFPAGTTQASFSVTTIGDAKAQGTRTVEFELANPTGDAALGLPPVTRVSILDDESHDSSLVDDFESFPYRWSGLATSVLSSREIGSGSTMALPGQGAYERVLSAVPGKGVSAVGASRSFPGGADWSDSSGLGFWYYGQGTGRKVSVDLTNSLPSTTTTKSLVWSDEFNTAAGTAPRTSTWGREIGDGSIYGIPGWGNDELEYYTDGTANAATDGRGSLVITARKADGSQLCYYGPCQYTSARLLTKNRFDVAYGRVEARVKVPSGSGLWPAFWMLGSNIDQASWPQSGEIDIMENVGRLPNQVFGTIHGPGYSGGQSYGRNLDLGHPVADAFHTFAVDWQPNRISWLLDGKVFFTATPDDAALASKAWVFNHPFYLLLNLAVGGNFGGSVAGSTAFPAAMKVDYVRLYQAVPETATFRATFRDDVAGWRKISLPFTSFVGTNGSTVDPSAVTSLAISTTGGASSPLLVDQLRLACPMNVTVTAATDDGAGSLRNALARVCSGGTITFSPALAGQTITFTSGPLTLGKGVTINGAAAPGLVLSGNHADRVLIVNAGVTAAVENVTLANGFGWQLAGGVLNNGTLTLDHATVTGNTMATDGGDFWQGGGGIYSGEGATLNLVDSTVAGNSAAWSGGGIYAFFRTTTTIVRSTISGNVSNDVGGGIRSLGNVTITNSTISGNRSTGWHGGAIFATDGDVTISSSTIADNIGPDWAPSAIFMGQWGGTFVPTLTLTRTVITGNHWYACERYASGTAANVVSGGYNVIQDGSCNPASTDVVVWDAGLGALADNGGPTLTQAPLPGSAAIDMAGSTGCPATDQRGISRPQGAACDAGAVEVTGG